MHIQGAGPKLTRYVRAARYFHSSRHAPNSLKRGLDVLQQAIDADVVTLHALEQPGEMENNVLAVLCLVNGLAEIEHFPDPRKNEIPNNHRFFDNGDKPLVDVVRYSLK